MVKETWILSGKMCWQTDRNIVRFLLYVNGYKKKREKKTSPYQKMFFLAVFGLHDIRYSLCADYKSLFIFCPPNSLTAIHIYSKTSL